MLSKIKMWFSNGLNRVKRSWENFRLLFKGLNKNSGNGFVFMALTAYTFLLLGAVTASIPYVGMFFVGCLVLACIGVIYFLCRMVIDLAQGFIQDARKDSTFIRAAA